MTQIAAQAGAVPAASRTWPHPLMVITLVTMLLPVTFSVGSLFFNPIRFLYLFTVPYMVIRLLRGDCGRLVLPDYMIALHVFWMAVTVGIHHPPQIVTFTGSTGLTIVGGYLTARTTIRTAADFQAFTRFFTGIIVFFLLPFGIAEAVFRSGAVLINMVENVPFFGTLNDVPYCCRLGLDRAQVVFVHPIHYGIFCSLGFGIAFLGLANQASFFKRTLMAGLVGLAAFMSVSSGSVLAVGFQGMLLLYAIALHNNPKQWRIAVIGGLVLYAILELNTTKFAFFTLAEKLAFDPWNVFIRGKLYDVGMEQVMRTPVFGFGYNRLPLPHWMTGSVDNYWLQVAVSHGVPGVLSLFLAFLHPMIFVGRPGRFTRGSDLYYARVSWTIVIIALTLSMATVALWAEVQSAAFMMLGVGMFLYTAQEQQSQATGPAPIHPSARAGGPAYTRYPGGKRRAAGRGRPAGLPAGARAAGPKGAAGP